MSRTVSDAEDASPGSTHPLAAWGTGVSLQHDLRDAVNDHITRVFAAHRLRYVTEYEGDTYFVCLCKQNTRFDRSSFNQHLQEELMV